MTRPVLIFLSGLLAGVFLSAIVAVAANFIRDFDHGVSLTYMGDELDTLKQESDVLRKMAEQDWLGLSADTAQERLNRLGVLDFAKDPEGFAAGPVFVAIDGGIVSEIRAHCSRAPSETCISLQEG